MSTVATIWVKLGLDSKGYKQGLDGASKQTQKSSSNITGSLSKIGKVAVAGFAVAAAAAAKFALDSTLLAARVETLGVVTEQLGRNAGYTASEMRGLEKAIQAQGITTQASRQALAMMVQANIDLAHSSDLARLAQDAAVIAGINSSEAFERLIQGTSRGQTIILRTMGIMADFQGAYKKLAKELGKTSAELTETEKATARVNEVLRQGKNIAGAYESAMETTGKKLSSFARHWEELMLAVGESGTESLGKVVDGATKFVDILEEGISIQNRFKEAQKLGIDTNLYFTETVARGSDGLMVLTGSLKDLEADIEDARAATERAARQFEGMSNATSLADKQAQILARDIEWVSETVMSANDAMRNYNETLLFNIASAGLTAEQALNLATQMGLVDKKTVFAYEAIRFLNEELARTKDIEEYNKQVLILQGQLASLPRNITIKIGMQISKFGAGMSLSGTGATLWPTLPLPPVQGPPLPPVTGGKAGKRALGGPVRMGSSYLVGERGPEMFVPGSSGSIVPNNAGMNGQAIVDEIRRGNRELLIGLRDVVELAG